MSEAAPSSTPAVLGTTPAPAGTMSVDTKAPPDKGATTDKPADSPKHKVKVDGEEREVTLEELLKGYQTNEAGQKRLKEVAEEKKKIGSVAEAAKKGDYTALRELGLSDDEIEQLSIKVLSSKQQSKLEEERRKALDPEKRELEDLRREKDERDQKDKEAATAEEQKSIATMEATLTKSVIDTLELLPEKARRSGFFANRALEAWEYAIEHHEEIEKAGIKVTPQFIADKVKAEAMELYKGMLTDAKDEELDTFIPADVFERRAKRVTPAADPPKKDEPKAHPALSSKPQAREPGEKPKEEKKRISDAKALRAATLGRR